jgi:hypothetical protein
MVRHLTKLECVGVLVDLTVENVLQNVLQNYLEHNHKLDRMDHCEILFFHGKCM